MFICFYEQHLTYFKKSYTIQTNEARRSEVKRFSNRTEVGKSLSSFRQN